MIKTRRNWAVWSVATVLFLASAAPAALVSQDDPDYGVGSITFDTDTGLQWLDVPLSQARTYLDVAGEFGIGGDFEGFRHAFGAELVQLYMNAGIPDINVSGGSAANVAPATALSNLVGPTAFQSGNPQTFGFYNDLSSGPLRFNGDIDFLFSNGNPAYIASTTLIARNEGVVFDSVGHWLVRIPEPGSAVLLWGCLAIWRLRRVRTT